MKWNDNEWGRLFLPSFSELDGERDELVADSIV